ncbi:MAG: hypothetical protein A3H70_02220 [Candidatus Komeilibacteria bacterium RIFCSPLOWO2_02_FULL_48_11]|uniref:Cell division protein FtsL n=1 Tax=Candidatus Komeilibacteria bacterium RIFCSPLOWO2_02_FULL_48_11 TaxID=1798553 RepID=A0A1G2BUK7_9BACT|nr:MAG: hypothetical protein A3H70_02220 [Candidatus Komeilibacteria bacterium RIFCSPLOWO2_02_FULL_48_11]
MKPWKLVLNWRLSLPVGILLFLLLYLQQTNNQAEQGFKIRKLEVTRDSLREEIRNLTWEVSAARSLATVQERARQLSLGTPTDVSFVPTEFSTVALSANQGDKTSP